MILTILFCSRSIVIDEAEVKKSLLNGLLNIWTQAFNQFENQEGVILQKVCLNYTLPDHSVTEEVSCTFQGWEK